MRKVVDETLVYVDTCIISGLARNDIPETESTPMLTMLGATQADAFSFVTSCVALDELKLIPKEHQTPHTAIYQLLGKVRALPEPSMTRLGLIGAPAGNPDRSIWSRLHGLLPDESDAKHVYQAYQNGARFFVTVDVKTILRHASELQNAFGIFARSPSELSCVSMGNPKCRET